MKIIIAKVKIYVIIILKTRIINKKTTTNQNNTIRDIMTLILISLRSIC